MSFGGKANNLIQLSEAGFSVPSFYIISCKETADLNQSGAKRRLQSRHEEWCKKNQAHAVAVRSSATVEDSDQKSYAGQFKTVLDVETFSELIEAIAIVRASLNEVKSLVKNAQMNIIVQVMIDASAAGVTFTMDPTGLSSNIIINARPGSGLNVVSGERSDQFSFNRTTQEGTPNSLRSNQPCIGKSDIKKLAQLAINIEKLFGKPQDIEWAIDSEGVHILQARPITAAAQIKVWDSANIVESYPGITLPLTTSVAKKAYAHVYRSQARLSGISIDEIEQNHHLFESLLGIYRGRLYYNLDSWYGYMSLFPNTRLNQQFFDKMIQTAGQEIHQSSKPRSLGFRLHYLIRTFRRVLTFRSEIAAFYSRVERELKVLDRLPAHNAEQAIERYIYLEEHLLPFWGTTVDNDFLAMIYNGVIEKLNQRWLKHVSVNNKTELLSGLNDVESAEQAYALRRLARDLVKQPRTRSLIKVQDYDEAWAAIEKSHKLLSNFQQYQERFGNRFALDLKLEIANPVVKPQELLRLLRPFTEQASTKPADRSSLGSEIKFKEARRSVLARLNPAQRLLYNLTLTRLRSHLRHREKMRLMRSKIFQVARESFSSLGEDLARRSVLELSDDIFYLEVDEVIGFMNGSLSIDQLKPLVALRQAEYGTYADQKLPDRFITTNIPKLDIENLRYQSKLPASATMSGLVSSAGIVRGRATVMLEPIIPQQSIGILVVGQTDPGWTPIIALCKGVVVEKGGMLSHAAIITRELGIPSLINVEGATSIIKNGDNLLLDAIKGTVTIEKANAATS